MSEEKESEGCGCGCGSFSLGAFLAIVLSWKTNASVVYAFLHAILGWLYVIYWAFAHW